MSWKPTDFFLTVQDLFGVLVPGAVGAAVLGLLFRSSQFAPTFMNLSTTAQWAAFGVASLVLGYLAYPPSHLFNKAYNLTYRRWKRAKGDALLEFAAHEAEKRVPDIRETGSVYEWAKTRVEAKDKSISREIGRIQGFSKMFRSLSLYLLIGVVAFGIQQEWEFCLASFIGLLLCFLVFCERRWAATTLVYQRFMDLEEESKAL